MRMFDDPTVAVNAYKIKVLEARFMTLSAALQDALNKPKEVSARDLAHQILMALKAQDVAIEAVVIARAQWVDDYDEPTTDEDNAKLDRHLESIARTAAKLVVCTPTPDLKETS